MGPEGLVKMRIVILGAGPAGLYLAYLIKRRQPDADVIVVEQNAADATFGFGVVFSDRALEFLHGDDPQTYAAIASHMESGAISLLFIVVNVLWLTVSDLRRSDV